MGSTVYDVSDKDEGLSTFQSINAALAGLGQADQSAAPATAPAVAPVPAPPAAPAPAGILGSTYFGMSLKSWLLIGAAGGAAYFLYREYK